MRTPFDDLVDDLQIRPPRPPAREAWRVFLILVVLIVGVLLAVHFWARARAQERPRVIFDCQAFSTYARSLAALRELGADRDKVLGELRRDVRPGMMLAVLEREVKLIWTGKPSRVEAEHSAFKRCQAQLGEMGREG